MLDLDLTKNEQKIFSLMLDHVVLSHNQILVDVHGVPEQIVDRMKTRAVTQAVYRLRDKLPDTFTVETVRGEGYRLLVG